MDVDKLGDSSSVLTIIVTAFAAAAVAVWRFLGRGWWERPAPTLDGRPHPRLTSEDWRQLDEKFGPTVERLAVMQEHQKGLARNVEDIHTTLLEIHTALHELRSAIERNTAVNDALLKHITPRPGAPKRRRTDPG